MSKHQKIARQAKKAESVWEARQLTAAAAWRQLHDAEKTILSFSEELTEEQRVEVHTNLRDRRQEVRDYLLKHRDLYVDRMNALGLVPTPMVGRSPEEEVDWSQVVAK